MDKTFDFDVALSFAGEDRGYVEEVANWLKKMDIKVFYDKYETVSLWGKNLYEHLSEIYNKRAKYAVIFISEHYANKLWTDHERKNAQARAFMEKEEYILPARFDNTEITGILPTIGYIDLTKVSPEEFAFMIKEKIGTIYRNNFFPTTIDRLYDFMDITDEEEQDEVFNVTKRLFDILRLMTPEERKILYKLYLYSCPNGIPDNLHINIEYFARILSIPKEEIISIFSRLDCLDLNSKVYEVNHNEDIDSVTNSMTCIEVKYMPLITTKYKNATFILISVIDCICDNFCIECADVAIENLDFSILSYLSGYSEREE